MATDTCHMCGAPLKPVGGSQVERSLTDEPTDPFVNRRCPNGCPPEFDLTTESQVLSD